MRLTERRTSAAVLVALASLAGSAALADESARADQSFTGIVTILDRTTSEVVIKQAPAGETTGANMPAAVEKFRLRSVPDTLHAGEKVTVTYTESNGIKTIGTINERKD